MSLDAELVKKQTSKPSIRVTSKLNPQTGIVSNAASKFSAENWGPATRNYVRSIEKMKAGSLEEIVKLATPYMSPLKTRRQVSMREPHALAKDDKDLRACLVDKWYVFLVRFSTLS